MQVEIFPKIVYKYRSWLDQYHRTILFANELYLSSPKDFNDPFDCRIPPNLFLLDSPEKKRKFIQKILKNNLLEFFQKGHNINSLNTMGDNFMLRLNSDLKKEQDLNEQLHFNQQDNLYGVLSFSRRWSINLMWTHYAHFHTGICIGFHEEKLRNSQLFGKGGRVEYTDTFPSIDPLDEVSIKNAFYETHTKERKWEYEKEYRLTKLFPKPALLADRIIKVPNDFYESITIGLNFPNNELLCIKTIAKEKNIPIYKIRKRQLSFKLHRVRIQ